MAAARLQLVSHENVSGYATDVDGWSAKTLEVVRVFRPRLFVLPAADTVRRTIF